MARLNLFYAALLLMLFGDGCSAVSSTYTAMRYNVMANNAVKRITVASWAPSNEAKLGEVMAQVGSDLVKLRKNYLVYNATVFDLDWASRCEDKQGVLVFRALNVANSLDELDLTIEAELWRCADGALLWRATAEESAEIHNDDLAQMTQSYAVTLGEAAVPYIAPVFTLLQDLMASLPNPQLNDAEVEEKLELGTIAHRDSPKYCELR